MDTGPLPTNQWFNVKAVMDVDAGTVDLYLNGGLVGSGLPWIVPEASFMFFAYVCEDPNLDGLPGMYVDNVRMETVDPIPEPGVLVLGAFELLALPRRRK